MLMKSLMCLVHSRYSLKRRLLVVTAEIMVFGSTQDIVDEIDPLGSHHKCTSSRLEGLRELLSHLYFSFLICKTVPVICLPDLFIGLNEIKHH